MTTYDQLEYRRDHLYYFEGVPFSGLVSGSDEDGSYAEEFIGGVRHGLCKIWYPNGQLKEESHCLRGSLHGEVAEYDSRGNILRIATYEHGVKLRSERFDQDGQLVERFQLNENDSNWDVLISLRDLHNQSSRNM